MTSATVWQTGIHPDFSTFAVQPGFENRSVANQLVGAKAVTLESILKIGAQLRDGPPTGTAAMGEEPVADARRKRKRAEEPTDFSFACAYICWIDSTRLQLSGNSRPFGAAGSARNSAS